MTRKHMYLKMVTSSLIRRRARMMIALLAIAIGATIMSGLVTIYKDIPSQLGKEFRSYGANMIILPDNSDTKISKDDLSFLKTVIPNDKIVGMAPYRYQTTKINEQPYIIAGTNLDEAKKNSPFWHIDGRWVQNGEKDKVMIGHQIAKTLDLNIGDKFRAQGIKFGKQAVVSSHTTSAEENQLRDIGDNTFAKTLTVEGIVTTGGKEEAFIFMDINQLNELVDDVDRIDIVECSIEGSAEELDVYTELIISKTDSITARPVKRVTQSQDIVLGKLQALVLLVSIIVLVLTMISVSTTMMAVVTERRKEIGLKKALGATNEEVIIEFLGEGFILGFLGGLLGVGFGFLFAQNVSLSVFGRAISFQWSLIPLTIIVFVIITILACLIPVRKAISIEPAIVLKGE